MNPHRGKGNVKIGKIGKINTLGGLHSLEDMEILGRLGNIKKIGKYKTFSPKKFFLKFFADYEIIS